MAKGLKPLETVRILHISELLVISPCLVVVILHSGRVDALLQQEILNFLLNLFDRLRLDFLTTYQPFGIVFILGAHSLLGTYLLLVLVDVVHIIKLLPSSITPYAFLFRCTLPLCSRSRPLAPKCSAAASEFKSMSCSGAGNRPSIFGCGPRSLYGSVSSACPMCLSWLSVSAGDPSTPSLPSPL